MGGHLIIEILITTFYNCFSSKLLISDNVTKKFRNIL